MPPDVRRRSALPSSPFKILGAAPQHLGVARDLSCKLPEGQRPSAHQAAQPHCEASQNFISAT